MSVPNFVTFDKSRYEQKHSSISSANNDTNSHAFTNNLKTSESRPVERNVENLSTIPRNSTSSNYSNVPSNPIRESYKEAVVSTSYNYMPKENFQQHQAIYSTVNKVKRSTSDDSTSPKITNNMQKLAVDDEDDHMLPPPPPPPPQEYEHLMKNDRIQSQSHYSTSSKMNDDLNYQNLPISKQYPHPVVQDKVIPISKPRPPPPKAPKPRKLEEKEQISRNFDEVAREAIKRQDVYGNQSDDDLDMKSNTAGRAQILKMMNDQVQKANDRLSSVPKSDNSTYRYQPSSNNKFQNGNSTIPKERNSSTDDAFYNEQPSFTNDYHNLPQRNNLPATIAAHQPNRMPTSASVSQINPDSRQQYLKNSNSLTGMQYEQTQQTSPEKKSVSFNSNLTEARRYTNSTSSDGGLMGASTGFSTAANNVFDNAMGPPKPQDNPRNSYDSRQQENPRNSYENRQPETARANYETRQPEIKRNSYDTRQPEINRNSYQTRQPETSSEPRNNFENRNETSYRNTYSPPKQEPNFITSQSTPKVVGAQELYRDPREKIMANRPRLATPGSGPERLSFRDKIRKFRTDIGENTPPNRIRVSKAQHELERMNGY